MEEVIAGLLRFVPRDRHRLAADLLGSKLSQPRSKRETLGLEANHVAVLTHADFGVIVARRTVEFARHADGSADGGDHDGRGRG